MGIGMVAMIMIMIMIIMIMTVVMRRHGFRTGADAFDMVVVAFLR